MVSERRRTPDLNEQLVDKMEEALRMMRGGFSVALYGVGSKICVNDGLVEMIHIKKNDREILVRVRGYDQTFALVRAFGAALGRVVGTTLRSMEDVVRAVERLPSSRRLFIIIDSIDAAPMKGFQDSFSRLADLPNVSLCASVDHCRIGLLWSPPQQRRFKWFWIEANTYHGYAKEVADLVGFWDSLIEGKSDAMSKTLSLVLASLTGNHRSIYQLIAEMQLEQLADKENKQGIAVQVRSTDLLARARKNMLTTNQVKMRSLLQELVDHRVVMQTKDKDTGNEVFWLPFDKDRLEAIKDGRELN